MDVWRLTFWLARQPRLYPALVREAVRLLLDRFSPSAPTNGGSDALKVTVVHDCVLDPVPALEGSRLRLRPFAAGDLVPLRVLNVRHVASALRHAAGAWAVLEKGSPRAVGYCSLTRMRVGETVETEVGYAIVPERRGLGYATDVLGLMGRFAHDELRCERLIAVVEPANAPSLRVVEKSGFRLWCVGVFYSTPVQVMILQLTTAGELLSGTL